MKFDLAGEFIKKIRKKNKITQVELSKLTGIPQSSISTIEAGSKVTLVDFFHIMSALGYQLRVCKKESAK